LSNNEGRVNRPRVAERWTRRAVFFAVPVLLLLMASVTPADSLGSRAATLTASADSSSSNTQVFQVANMGNVGQCLASNWAYELPFRSTPHPDTCRPYMPNPSPNQEWRYAAVPNGLSFMDSHWGYCLSGDTGGVNPAYLGLCKFADALQVTPSSNLMQIKGKSGDCLSMAPKTSEIQWEPCTSSRLMLWSFDSYDTAFFRASSSTTNLCLTVDPWEPPDWSNVEVELYTCGGPGTVFPVTVDQEFRQIYLGSSAGIWLMNSHTQDCLTELSGPFHPVEAIPCDPTNTHQNWWWHSNPNNGLVNLGSSLCATTIGFTLSATIADQECIPNLNSQTWNVATYSP
jgi:hypothetical protein